MTRLAGEFTMMLSFSSPAKVIAATLQDAFAPLSKRLRLAIHLTPLLSREALRPAQAGAPYMISVYGADRPGIVFRVSEALAARGVNITDVQTRRSGPAGGRRKPSLYLMVLEVELPRRLSAASLERTLQRIGKRLGVEVSLRSAEAELL